METDHADSLPPKISEKDAGVEEDPLSSAEASTAKVELRSKAEDEIVPCPPGSSPPSMFSSSGLSSWAKSFNAADSAFTRFTSELGLHLPTKGSDEVGESPNTQVGGALESLTKAVVDSSLGAVKAMQVKARHIVSQNKRRYQV